MIQLYLPPNLQFSGHTHRALPHYRCHTIGGPLAHTRCMPHCLRRRADCASAGSTRWTRTGAPKG
eukprot:352494-Chlamydomonas_euryale.AAC.1